jgi:hypothetical protein
MKTSCRGRQEVQIFLSCLDSAIRYKQEEQNEYDQKNDRPSGKSAKYPISSHNDTSCQNHAKGSLIIALVSGSIRNEQEEQNKDDQEYDCPPGISAKNSVHAQYLLLNGVVFITGL